MGLVVGGSGVLLSPCSSSGSSSSPAYTLARGRLAEILESLLSESICPFPLSGLLSSSPLLVVLCGASLCLPFPAVAFKLFVLDLSSLGPSFIVPCICLFSLGPAAGAAVSSLGLGVASFRVCGALVAVPLFCLGSQLLSLGGPVPATSSQAFHHSSALGFVFPVVAGVNLDRLLSLPLVGLASAFVFLLPPIQALVLEHEEDEASMPKLQAHV
ncbi:unnamed protein product [Thlaspi arvense]|uniref:Transmembrane protein n=1 Tax=Thlaspi arvense TaxID=13288 RepID=A0AAU9SAW8_THLAR|nr:unnamed protein product [Thlaspi arvense]